MIATPIVLGIINDARENSEKRSVDNIIHAAELYYMQQQMNGSSTNKLDFDLSDKNNGLEYEGERPEGMLTIYPDGKIYINAKFDDGSTYTKLPNETTVVKDKIVVGNSSIWKTDGEGKITKYDVPNATDPALNATMVFVAYSVYSIQYATADRVDENGEAIEGFNMTLPELLELDIEGSGFYRTEIPLELNKELDIAIEIFDVDHQLTEGEYNALLEEYQAQIPHVIDVANNLETYGEQVHKYKAYETISKYFGSSEKILTIPNYVRHEDGTLEEIKIIGEHTFYRVSVNGNNVDLYCVLSSHQNDLSTLVGGYNVIIPEGIEQIEDTAFGFCGLDSVSFPNTLKSIGGNAFSVNNLNSIILPKSLQILDTNAFSLASLKGTLTIPSEVKEIGRGAFLGLEECDDSDTQCKNYSLFENNITDIVFEDNSKIEYIAQDAFKHNNVNSIIIPGSIKTIGEDAFNMTTLKSVIIERAEGDDLSIGENAFGSATIEYRP